MKNVLKVLVTTIALTIACVTPVLATETDIDKEMQYINKHVEEVGVQISSYLTTDDGCGSAAKLDHGTHAKVVDTQLLTWVANEEANYINYLKQTVVNKKETERIKQQNVSAIAELVKVNPGFQAQYNAAVAEYNAALADRLATEASIDAAQQRFATFNICLNNVVAGGIAHNAAIDK